MITVAKHLLAAICLTLTVLWGAAAWAQDGSVVPDYETWQKTASVAEDAIETEKMSTVGFEDLRDELANWREEFRDRGSVNSNAIAIVNDQLAALGPVPESGTEDADTAQQREDLNTRLSELEAPVKRAELAYRRADGMISGVDDLLRERRKKEFLTLGPSPLNPKHWEEALFTVGTTLRDIHSEIASAWDNPKHFKEIIERTPIAIVLALIGLFLLVKGRSWGQRLTDNVLGSDPPAARRALGFLVSLSSMFLPLLGVFIFVQGVYLSGFVGLRGDFILKSTLPSMAVYLFARWLTQRVFSPLEQTEPILRLTSAQRKTGRWCGDFLGAVTGLYLFTFDVAQIGDWESATRNVILYPLIVIAALLLFRLAQLVLIHSRIRESECGEATYRSRLSHLTARTLMGLAIAPPILGAVGYFAAAQGLMLPTLLSLQIWGALLVVQRLVGQVYVMLTHGRSRASDSLILVVINFCLSVLILPILALVWGARWATLTEYWTKLNEGVSLGETQISPTVFFTLVIVFVIGFLATRLIQGALKATVLPKTKLDPGAQSAMVSGFGYIGIFLAALAAIVSAGINLSSIAIVAGALSVGIGFGLQTIVSNFVSGIILLIERPISEGDWIEVGGNMGYVRDISVRATRIETFDRYDVIVPNSDLVSGTVTNYTRGNTIGRVIVPVGVAYGTDTRRVEKILMEIGEAHPMVLADPAPYVVFQGFGDSSIDFEIRAILRDVNWVLNVRSDMNHEIARRFTEEGISIPFPQRDIWMRSIDAEQQGGLAGVARQTQKQGEDTAASSMYVSEADLGGGQSDGDGGGGDGGGDGGR
ncbi:putative MscS family protein.1 precursor [Roseovarius albus]|uniref:Putative MscS family protein.1 n=1 Tax=Roseovarius albus TaxID=1247867 RepID=A0A1X6YCF5_9RHOB|nr:DUF3772 domain-containing protein [Roseovarius albus]SLN17237.1 putative MscS family protein.1 precursor [Roseovarius albus]